MKKLVRKLALSCVALGACALTLASTTYAWWTTNTEVGATNIQGQASTTGDASIFISKDDGLNWAQSVDMTDKMFAKDENNEVTTTLNFLNLSPVQLVNTAETGATPVYEFKTLENGAAPTGAVLQFDLWFKTAKTTTDVVIYISDIVLSNTATDVAETAYFDNLLANTTGDNVGVDRTASKYWVDITKSLAMWTKAENGTNAFIDLQTFDTSPLTDVGITQDESDNYTPDALAYYNEVMGSNESKGANVVPLITPQTALSTTARTPVVTVPSTGGKVKVTFYIFLNGWDEYCYDAVKGQGFKINLGFSSIEKATTTPAVPETPADGEQ